MLLLDYKAKKSRRTAMGSKEQAYRSSHANDNEDIWWTKHL